VFGDGGVSVLNRWHYENCISFKLPLTIAIGSLVALHIEHDPTPREGLTIYAAHQRSRTLGPAERWLLDDLRRRLS
jgi:DNA-binding transcriptional LysR family regulator